MKIILTLLLVVLSACTTHHKSPEQSFTLAFGSCNRQNLENHMWSAIEENHPDVWVWGGDNIYSDTDDMQVLKDNYAVQKNNPAYKHFRETTPIIGTWDDHDYGLNDGGVEYSKKAESEQLFLDFMDVAIDDPRRLQAGIYTSHNYKIGDKNIKVLVLDTRYFRTAITEDPDPSPTKRYKPNKYGDGTILGKEQWQWLTQQLNTSQADYNLIISSIQFLSPYHGFEKWQNMPHEVDKLEKLVQTAKAKNIIILSGDRHISELSSVDLEGLEYPLIDFTASGLTHSYGKPKIEENPYRKGKIIVDKTFGLLKFDLKMHKVIFQLRDANNKTLESYQQIYSD
jgi:alkaline phosphatase D